MAQNEAANYRDLHQLPYLSSNLVFCKLVLSIKEQGVSPQFGAAQLIHCALILDCSLGTYFDFSSHP